jgi:hypothetical protein
MMRKEHSMRLVDAALTESAKARDEAAGEYAALLASADPLGEQDDASARRLATLIETLGKSAADVDADVRLVQRAARLREQVEAGHGASKRAAEARRTLADYDAETARIMEDRREGYRARYAELRRVEKLQVDASVGAGELERLVAQHPQLLADVDRETPAGGDD